MNILAILYCYPPFLLPATICYLKLLVGLEAQGFGTTAVTVDPDSYRVPDGSMVDRSLLRFVPSGTVNHTVRSWESTLLFRALKRFDLGYRTFYRLVEPRKREWTFPALRSLRRLDPDSYDLILSCSQPHANHLIGYELKKKTAKPWIAYFSDPWAGNPYAHFRSKRICDYNARLERTIIASADAVLFTSPEMLKSVMRGYDPRLRKKCGVLPHSFIPEWYEANGGEAGRSEDRAPGKVRFVHTGHFYGPRTPLPFLAALDRLNRERSLEGRVEVEFYGSMPQEHRAFISARGMDRVVRIRETVPYLASLAVMRRADYLILVDAPLPGGGESVFLPSKLIDYIGSGRPVIGFTPGRGASARVLRESGNLVCALERPEESLALLRRAIDGTCRPSPDPDAVNRYHYLNVTGSIHSIIKEMR